MTCPAARARIGGPRADRQGIRHASPTPIVSADSSIAFRYEADPRWGGFLQSWMTYNIKLGVIPNWVKQGLVESGVPAETLPELMHKAGY